MEVERTVTKAVERTGKREDLYSDIYTRTSSQRNETVEVQQTVTPAVERTGKAPPPKLT